MQTIMFDIPLLIVGLLSLVWLRGDLLGTGLHELEPGHYVVTSENGVWSHEVAREPRFAVTVEADPLLTFLPQQLHLSIRNLGNVAYRGSVQLWIDSEEVKRWDDVIITDSLHETINWSPERSGKIKVFLHIGSDIFPLESIHVAPSSRVAGREAFELSVFGGARDVVVGLLLLMSFFAAFAMWRLWRRL